MTNFEVIHRFNINVFIIRENKVHTESCIKSLSFYRAYKRSKIVFKYNLFLIIDST